MGGKPGRTITRPRPRLSGNREGESRRHPHSHVASADRKYQSVAERKEDHRLECQSVLRRAIRPGLGEGNRILQKEADHEPGKTSVNGRERRTHLPGPFTGELGGRCREHKGRTHSEPEPRFRRWPGRYNQIKQLHVAKVGPAATPGVGTVTNEKVGRMSWTKGKRVFGGIRGMMTRATT